ncbi:hypothetical protein ACVWZA_001993 [Sphingomonas sp. UYAg733]
MTTDTDIRNVPALLDGFRRYLMTDVPLQQRLAALYEGNSFAAAVAEAAIAAGISLSSEDVWTGLQPDPLGLSRFDDRPANDIAWPDKHWLPSAMVAAGPEFVVDWMHFAGRRLTDPFFNGSLTHARALPLNRLMRYRTPLGAFAQGAEGEALTVPNGFIFHLSRCGSTLAAQMLAAMDDTIVVSEPPPLDAVVQLTHVRKDVPFETRVDVLRTMVGALGRDWTGAARNYVVKLDSWHALELPLFRQAFPDTPWVFLYRDPVEILVSHMRMRGLQAVPGGTTVDFGIIDGGDMPFEEYTARVLRSVSNAVIDHHGLGGGLVINYDALPGAIEAQILPHFGIAPGAEAIARLRTASERNAKAPGQGFNRDTERKQQDATPAIRAAAAEFLAEPFRQLEALRLAPGAA